MIVLDALARTMGLTAEERVALMYHRLLHAASLGLAQYGEPRDKTSG